MVRLPFAEPAMPAPSNYVNDLCKILVSFGRVGLFALGGGNGMIKMIGDEAVHIRKWFSIDEFSSLLGMTYLFPGLTACKLSGMIGYRVAGIGGLVVAALAINIPGIVLTAVGFLFLINYTHVPIVNELLLAMQFAAMALIAAVLYDMIRPAAKQRKYWIGIVLTAAFFLALELFHLPVIACLLVYLVVYIAAPFWTPPAGRVRVSTGGDSVAQTTQP
jgi:chromate transporter